MGKNRGKDTEYMSRGGESFGSGFVWQGANDLHGGRKDLPGGLVVRENYIDQL